MEIKYNKASIEDIEVIYQLCKKLIDDYENLENIDYHKVLMWVKRKIENSLDEYTAVFVNGEKAGYYHFFRNEEGELEIDDLYILKEFQNKGIGSMIINKCCSAVNEPVILYVFKRNQKAISFYDRLGFEIVKEINDSRYIMKKSKL